MASFLKRALPWILFGVAAIAAVTFAFLWQQQRAAENREDEVRSRATEFVLALTNFSADSIEEDAAKIQSFAVGQFEEEAETFFGTEAVEAIQEAEASSSGTIESVFVQSVEDDSAAVFAVVEQSVSNAGNTDGTSDTLRMEISMVLSGDEWKVENVDVLQSPGTVVPGT